ncbi:MAG: aminotransferase class I/II-fold pyridoxal phosphate-dependent enzyme [Cyclobacteriaceae bacterium]
MKSQGVRGDSEGKKGKTDSPAEKKNSLQGTDKTPQDPFGDFFDDYANKLQHNPLLNDRQKQKIEVVNKTRNSGFYTFQQAFDAKSGALITLNGTEYKLLSSYDYLGLIGHKEIEKSAVEAINKFGTGSGGVRLLTGTNKLHLELENDLAHFTGTEAAVTYSSGYHANLAVLSSLMDSKDLALIDSKIHQSTLDACKLAGLPHRRFEHNNPNSLEDLLKQHHSGGRVLIISEGMFSMDGDICKLKELVALKKKYGAFLMIDEAHSLGVLGENGKGVASHFNISPHEIDIITGSLSKAIPASGGYVAGSRELIIFLQHGSSPFIFSAALGPAATATATMALKVFQTEPERRKKLWANTQFFVSELQKSGFDTGLSSTPIIPVILGSDEAALSFSRKLFDRGVLATPVIFPAVPKQQSRLRLCITASQEKPFLQEVLDIFRQLR